MDKNQKSRLTNRPLFYWITRRYRGLQLLLLAVIIISLFFRVYPLEMQRRIINVAISLRKVDLLYFYCGLYLGAVIIAGLLKYFINTFQAIIGQKLLIELRNELYNHILQLPITFFHRTQAGTVISAMTAELSAIGTFLGGALAIPITAFLTFTAFAGFMIYLNPFLGLISMLVYPFELILVPFLQTRYNKMNQQRVAAIRQMANLVNEAASGIHEVQGNASFDLEKTKLERVIHRLYKIMKRLSILKYGIKFSNNLFQSLGPFLLFLIGGYLAINGQFTIGALVAFLSAYEKVYDPWKEIIEYYQGYQDAKVRYGQIMASFNLEPQYLIGHHEDKPKVLDGHIKVQNLCYSPDGETLLLEDINLDIPSGKHLALIGFSGSGKSTLSMLLGQLYSRSEGNLFIGGYDIDELTKVEIARNVSFVAQHPFIFTGTVRDNLLYGCNALYLAGALDELPDRRELVELLTEIGLDEDVIRWGLRTTIHPKKVFPMVAKFLEMREITLLEIKENFSHVVELYDPNSFLEYSPIAINILFSSYDGTPDIAPLLTNHPFRTFLKDSGLENQLVHLGQRIAETTISFLGDLHDDDFFFQGSPMRRDEFEHFRTLLKKVRRQGVTKADSDTQEQFLSLALRFTPGKHKIYTISEELKDIIVVQRHRFLEDVLGIDLEQCRNGVLQRTIYDLSQVAHKRHQLFFTPFCASQYLYTHPLLDNIVFGTVVDPDMLRSILGPMITQQFARRGLLDEIFDVGLDFHVGSKGDNLSGGQKQKIALARALLKKCPILILDEATASLDNTSQTKIQRYINQNLKEKTTVIAVVHRLDMISGYDHILVMKNGKIIEAGTYPELMKLQGILYDLINSK